MAKTGAPSGRVTRQSKRLNPEAVVEENASPEDQTKAEDIQKAEEDKPEIDEESDTTDTKLESGDVKDCQSESGPADVNTEDKVKDESEDFKTMTEDKQDAKEEEVELPSTGVTEHPELPLQEVKDNGDAEVETVIEVKGSAQTVSVSWEKDEQPDEPMPQEDDQTRTDNTEILNEEQAEVTSTQVHEDTELPQKEEVKDEIEAQKDQPTETDLVEEETTEDKDEEIEIIEDKETEMAEEADGSAASEVEMKSSAGEVIICEKAVQEAESGEEEDEEAEEEEDSEEQEAEIGDQKEAEKDEMTEDKEVEEEKPTQEKVLRKRRKRKAKSSVDSAPSKKVKLINDGYCLYVGNLNNSKYYEDIKNALANYFMTQSLLVQDIRLDKAKRFAFVDLASQMDLTKALTLNGQNLLDKPLKIAKAKVKESNLEKKKKDPLEVQKIKNERCIHVENIPPSATREDVLKVFPKAIAVRFLGGADNPSKGVAFVQFQNKHQAAAARSLSETTEIQGSVLHVNVVRESAGVRRVTSRSKRNKKAQAPPCDTLFVKNLPLKCKKEHLKKIFKKAVNIDIPQRDGKSTGYAFVEFASVAHAENALKLSRNSTIHKKPLKVQFGFKSNTDKAQVASKTLIILGLHENTTASTLAEAFDGALASRILMEKDTGLSRKFGFVEFESADSCRLAKEAAEEMVIDGRHVTVAFARPKGSEGEIGLYRREISGPTPVKESESGGEQQKKTRRRKKKRNAQQTD